MFKLHVICIQTKLFSALACLSHRHLVLLHHECMIECWTCQKNWKDRIFMSGGINDNCIVQTSNLQKMVQLSDPTLTTAFSQTSTSMELMNAALL